MRNWKKAMALILACVIVAAPLSGCGGKSLNYPTGDVTVICPWGEGGGTDACLRAFSRALSQELGQSFTVVNRTGGGGVVGHEAIANADRDGYTIGMITFELSTYGPMGTSKLTGDSYDLLCRVNTDSAAVTVNARWAKDNGIRDLAGFIDYCKAHPGEVQMGGSSNVSVWHIAGGYLMEAAGIDLQMLTYDDGAATAVRNAADGLINGVTVSLAEARASIESGELICLGVMDDVRNPAFPDIPTCKEQGVDAIYSTWRGLAAPKGLDKATLKALRNACGKAIENADFKNFMAGAGQSVSYLDADAFKSFLEQNAQDVAAAMEALGL